MLDTVLTLRIQKGIKKKHPIKEINKMLGENITRGNYLVEEEATHQEQGKGGGG